MASSTFITQSVMTTLGLEHIGLAERAKILNQLVELVQRRLMVRILDELNDEKMQAFSELLERNEEHKIAAFIEEHLPNFYDLVLEESMRVKLEMAELVKDLPQE